MKSCVRCELSGLVGDDPLPFTPHQRLAFTPHAGVSLVACPDCGQLFVRLWREVGGWDIEDIWRFWAPVSAEEADALREGDAIEMAKDLVLSRPRLVEDPDQNRAVRNDSFEPGIWMHT